MDFAEKVKRLTPEERLALAAIFFRWSSELVLSRSMHVGEIKPPKRQMGSTGNRQQAGKGTK